MGFFSELVSGVVKVAISPVAVVKDVVDVASGKEANNTKKILKSASKDFENSGNELSDLF